MAVYTVKDLIQILPFSQSTIYEYLRQGLIPNSKLRGKIIILEDDLKEALEKFKRKDE